MLLVRPAVRASVFVPLQVWPNAKPLNIIAGGGQADKFCAKNHVYPSPKKVWSVNWSKFLQPEPQLQRNLCVLPSGNFSVSGWRGETCRHSSSGLPRRYIWTGAGGFINFFSACYLKSEIALLKTIGSNSLDNPYRAGLSSKLII